MEGAQAQGDRDKAKVPRMTEGGPSGTMVTSTPAHQSVARLRHDSEMDSGYTTATPTSADTPCISFRDPHHPARSITSTISSSTPCSSLFPEKFTPIPVSPLHADWNVQEEELHTNAKFTDSQVSHDSGHAYDSHGSQDTSVSHNVPDSQDTPCSQDSCIGTSISGEANPQDKADTLGSSPDCHASLPLLPVNLVSKFLDREEEKEAQKDTEPEVKAPLTAVTEEEEPEEKVQPSSSTCPGSAVSTHSVKSSVPSSPEKQSLLRPGRVIGALIGISRLDIIRHLEVMGVHFLNAVFSFLEPKDVSSFSCVCHIWHRLVYKNRAASAKLKLHIAEVKAANQTKENQGKIPGESQPMTISTHIMGSVQLAAATPPPRPPSTDPPTRTEIFQQAASTLTKEEWLRQCPQCFLPSKISPGTDKVCCLSESCSYEFCAKCLSEFHEGKPCTLLRRAAAGHALSKQSRKNLKRL